MNIRKPTPGVAAIREAGYTGFDNSLESKCRRPEKYGVQLTPGALQALNASGIPAPAEERAPTLEQPKRRYPENRRNPYRVIGRLNKAQNTRLQRALKLSHHKTIQEFVAAAVERYAAEILSENGRQT